MRADCIRVTHPYATLGLILLSDLPFGLHVLGLPLAFILSQDQTLHSIFFTNSPLALPVDRDLRFQAFRLLLSSSLSSFVLSIIVSFCPVVISQQLPYLLKKRLGITFHHVIPGPLSISICSMNVRFHSSVKA